MLVVSSERLTVHLVILFPVAITMDEWGSVGPLVVQRVTRRVVSRHSMVVLAVRMDSYFLLFAM